MRKIRTNERLDKIVLFLKMKNHKGQIHCDTFDLLMDVCRAGKVRNMIFKNA